MADITNLLIGIVVLAIGFPLGNWLAKATKDELKQGQLWFKLIILVSILGILISLIIGYDILLFTFAFVAIVTSRSLKR